MFFSIYDRFFVVVLLCKTPPNYSFSLIWPLGPWKQVDWRLLVIECMANIAKLRNVLGFRITNKQKILKNIFFGFPVLRRFFLQCSYLLFTFMAECYTLLYLLSKYLKLYVVDTDTCQMTSNIYFGIEC